MSTIPRIPADFEEKRTLLLKRLGERNTVQNIGKRQRVSPCLLSFAQERLWFLNRLEPDDPFYNMAGLIRITGPLNGAVLEQALQAVVRRHEILRTGFSSIDGEPRQVVQAHGGFVLRQIDLRDVPFEQRRRSAESLQQQEARQPFDLEMPPLMRALLVRLEDEHYRLSIILHHIVADEWSLRLLIREVGLFYRSLQIGQPPAAPEPAIQYADFAEWQRQTLQGERYEKQLAYWQSYLAEAPASPDLPADYPRPPRMTYRGGDFRFSLPDVLAAALINLSRKAETTLFAVMMAAFNVLLWRYSGQNDLSIGYPVANRNRREIEDLIGFFVNLQVLRCDLSGNPSFTTLLQQVKRHLLLAQSHQDLPFERLVEALQPQRELNRSPLFQVMLAYQHAALDSLDIPGLHFELAEADLKSAKYDLTLNVFRSGDRIACNINYSGDLFAESTINRMAGHWRQLLTSIVDHPGMPISELCLLTDIERRQILHDWNAAAVEYPQDRCIHQVFEAQVEQTPNAIALTFEDQSLTYAQLNAKANGLAHYLIERGVGPDVLVGLCLERSLEMVIGVLGILKAGGAYVPIEPNSPKERVAHQLQDTGTQLLVTMVRQLPSFQEAGIACACIDRDWPEIEKCSALNPPGKTFPSQLAYVIYTSGSTGLPKGVMVSHQEVRRLFAATEQQFGIGPEDVWTMFHSFAFDFSVWEIWGALLYGGRLVIVPYCVSRSPDEFHRLLQRESVTVLNQTPSAFLQLMCTDELQTDRIKNLRLVIFGGEALEPYKLKTWFERYGDRHPQLVNMYGITETTVHVTYRLLTERDAETTTASPIGRPIADLQAYLLDASLNLCPVGCPGELHVGGAGLARGYLNRPDLTAERFIPNSYGKAGSRLYKSGDLAKYRSDGEMDYLGRIDHQVKLRGFRIELGEIETQLLKHSAVKEAVVLVREDQLGDKRLVAYVVPEQLATLQLDDLKVQLQQALPDYMVPGAFVILEQMPLNANGKLDRKKLPAPESSGLSAREYEAPQGEVETAIADVWQALLGVERVSRHDHFFELGGHSLLAVIFVQRLQQRGLSADVRSVFAAPVLSNLAKKVTEGRHEAVIDIPPNLLTIDGLSTEQGPSELKITPGKLTLIDLAQREIDDIVANVPGGVANIQDIYPLAPLQEGILFHHLLDTQGDTYLLRSVVAFDTRAMLDRFTAALQQVIDRHDILRSAMFWQDLPQPVQVVFKKAALPVHTLEPQTGDVLTQLLAATDPNRVRLDVSRAPLLAAYIVADPRNGEWLLALLTHHLVCDHISLEFIIAEIQLLLQGRSSELQAPVPYRNFIAQLRAASQERHEDYFCRQLGDVCEPTSPFRLLDVKNAGEIVEVRRVLPEVLSIKIGTLARQYGVSAAVLFHLAWARVLAQCCGHDDVVFGTVLTGRLQGSPGIERTLGMFINTLPVRVKVGNIGVRQAVAEMHRNLSELLVHEQASLALAQRCSGVDTALPLFSTLLNYRHSRSSEKSEANWDGMRIIVGGEERTNYPITLSVDDFGTGFGLTLQCADGLQSKRLHAYMLAAVDAMTVALVDNPELPMCAISVVAEEERRQMFYDWNATEINYPQDRCIHQLFEAQAEQTPDAIALRFEDQSLSYAELNAKANQLAHSLIARGVGPDVLVGLCIERSLEMMIGLLGILKAGAAYVPLDPNYPEERLAFMLADIAPPVVLTQAELAAGRQFGAAQVLHLGCDWARIDRYPTTNPHPDIQPTNLAYCIYTSGSTGEPKGAGVPHQGILNRLHWMQAEYRLDGSDSVVQKTPFSFDVSVWEFFWPLMTGARLVIAKPELHKDSQGLVELIKRERITTIHFVPSMLQAFVETPGIEQCTSLKRVICSGEALPADLVYRFQQKLPAELHNLYGPTEASVDVSYWACRPDCRETVIPIGKPIANIRLYILDRELNPVPVGTPGELHIAGVGLGRGYLNRPGLTAEKFVPDPYGPEGSRLYKTGDLVRYRPDGTIDYLGRIDHQVKLRGFRIELGEIEAQVLKHSAVKEAVVLVREDQPGDKRLVAYLVEEQPGTLPLDGLKAQLKQALPDYMVPSVFVVLEQMPLSANGKLDRRRLPVPDSGEQLGRQYIAPRTETEQILAEIWQEVLGIGQVGIEDDFFELGGHSLLATQLASRISKRFAIKLPLRNVFEASNIGALAKKVDVLLWVTRQNDTETDTFTETDFEEIGF
jgi:amino acid adenylation domain-containing protein